MAHPFTVVYDANILYPAPLRDLFIRIAQAGLVRAKWTETIHDERTRNVLKDNPNVSAERLSRTRRLMNDAVRDCLVTDYDRLIDALQLPDPDDRHVLAAAIRADAHLILTCNLKDFPAKALERFRIKAQHPDVFLVELLAHARDEIIAVVKRQRESLRSPPKTAEELLDIFERHGLRRSAARLRGFVEDL